MRHPAPIERLRDPHGADLLYRSELHARSQRVDAQGRLLFAAGTRKNPLDVVSLSRRLLFFDGRDERQVCRARELIAGGGTPIKPILTGGSYLDLMKSWRSPVYYDQQGTLIPRLGIRQVPALVSQEGSRLRIDELALR